MNSRHTLTLAFLLGLGLQTASGAGLKTPPLPAPSATPLPDGELCLDGRVTGEGVECPAFRDARGRLYSLLGKRELLEGLKPGDSVCVCGMRVEFSICMQGTPLKVTRISPAPCP